MLTRRHAIIALVALPFTVALLAAQAPSSGRHVVLVSIDGFGKAALDDPSVSAPTVRRMASEGLVASMQPVNPSVTWPNHTAMVTGVRADRHSVLYNGWAVRGGPGERITVEPHVPKVQLVAVPTVYDAAHARGLTTAEIDWVAIEKAPTITWSFSEWPRLDGPVEREMIAAGLVTEEQIRDFTKLPITLRDEIWTRAAEHLTATHRPNLLLYHLLTTDSVQHRYGPGSLAAYTALALADAKLERLVAAYRAAGLLDRTTFLVVSDHGFRAYTQVVRPNVMLKNAGLGDSAWVISEGGTAMVYATRPGNKASPIAAMQKLFTGAQGIARVLTPAEFPQFGYPQPDANPRMADLVLAAADGFAFNASPEGEPVGSVPEGTTPGAHGYLNDDPQMQSIFVAWGAGVERGQAPSAVRAIDVAPTIARLLGFEMADVEGKAIELGKTAASSRRD